MKKLFAALFICALLTVAFNARAAQTVLLGSLVGVNGTSNSPSLLIGSVYPPRGLFAIQNGGVVNTNAFTVNVQLSIDNTNFFNVATYGPGTNSLASYSTNTTETFNPNYSAISIYLRAQAITVGGTNVYLGGIYTQ